MVLVIGMVAYCRKADIKVLFYRIRSRYGVASLLIGVSIVPIVSYCANRNGETPGKYLSLEILCFREQTSLTNSVCFGCHKKPGVNVSQLIVICVVCGLCGVLHMLSI